MRHPNKSRKWGINDAVYAVTSANCPYYKTWVAMINRVFCPKSLARNPTYIGCSVVPEWVLFSNFKKWMEGQDWMDKQLDKDILVPGNKVYGPDTCLFVSHQINGLLATQPKLRGDLPIGVTRHLDRYKVTFKKNKKTVHVGVFNSIEEAAEAYRLEKAAWVEHHASKELDSRVRDALLRAAHIIRKEIM